MDKRRLRMISKVLREVKAQFPQIANSIEERIEEECSKENMSKEQVIFFLHTRKQRFSTEKNIFLFCRAKF